MFTGLGAFSGAVFKAEGCKLAWDSRTVIVGPTKHAMQADLAMTHIVNQLYSAFQTKRINFKSFFHDKLSKDSAFLNKLVILWLFGLNVLILKVRFLQAIVR